MGAIRFHLEFYFASRILLHEHVIRKFLRVFCNCNALLLRFDGINFEPQPESNYPHAGVNSLGVYGNKPFVTGSDNPPNKKTEILDYETMQWMLVTDYPFSSGNR